MPDIAPQVSREVTGMTATMSVALKEWAVAVDALVRGETIVVIRKGGIREETKDFQVKSESFLFFPTFEHQKEHLVKPPFRERVGETLRRPAVPGQVCLQAWARVTHELLIEDERSLGLLSPYHIWTEQYAEERLRWKRIKPLHALLLRVYRLKRDMTIGHAPEYDGCKSWIDVPVPDEPPLGPPALSDEAYARTADLICRTMQK